MAVLFHRGAADGFIGENPGGQTQDERYELYLGSFKGYSGAAASARG